ncbi:SpvB/TcaC N-terminal domain-containing protein [Pantoea endophytica]|uniref:SpvB/TcaC N-terminal domain-containing protein n=1 Tax=Pantoea endophytica TaxID=92488 RepID=UPI00301A9791
MQSVAQPTFVPPALPSGGGTHTGMKGDLAAAGPDGAAILSVPLPVSAGRGYAPSSVLTYHSRAGNGPFGMGWNVNLPAIRRRTTRGVPAWDDADEFTGPEGEVIVPALDDSGAPQTRLADTLLGTGLGAPHRVTLWRPRTEVTFSRLERWADERRPEQMFWVIYSPDGQVHLLGRNDQARISDPQTPGHTAVWLTESSVAENGEQIYWQYRAENDDACDEGETGAHPNACAQRYLAAVWYGNRTAGRVLPALTAQPSARDWLFALVFDYGERSTDPQHLPAWCVPGSGAWPRRQDCFSGREYGFDLRTRRLCRQILMYHRITALSGEEREGDEPCVVSRLLLNYDETPCTATLTGLQQMAYEPDGEVTALPPLTFSWQTFSPPITGEAGWHRRRDLEKMNLLQPYQMADLNGEGIPGILYQDGGAWWYREPVRQAGGDNDAVTWGDATALPAIPALREGGILTDLNGDGYPEWVVTASGAAGYYERTPGKAWRQFTPLSALPVEFAHPRALLTDITGAGLADLALIGPKSVRFYAGTGAGWGKAQTVMQAAGVTLPPVRTDARVLVAFSDMTGSGQQHLVEVRAAGVRYWPNQGRGHFGLPVHMTGFSQPDADFSPDRLYLADIDGTGTTDLIYALSDRIDVCINQSGNSFAAPFSVKLPDGVSFDHTCSLQIADIQGLGVASIVLTTPHPVPRHWVYHLAKSRPWLLNGMNNNMGASHTLHYRSSAQYWLDEKAAAEKDGGPPPVCHLPLALHTLCRTEAADEITGNRLVSTLRFRLGVWDPREREFRGFGFVESADTDVQCSQGSAPEVSYPAVTRRWYATGLPQVDNHLAGEYWHGDGDAFPGFLPRFTDGSGPDEMVLVPDDMLSFWMSRGMKGTLLRSELYGADGSTQAGIPYTVTENRAQVRLVQAAGACPVIWPVVAESRTYVYERVSSDPQCHHAVLLSSDGHGQPLRQVDICYPRRARPAQSPYPDFLPDTLFADSYDPQQQMLRLTLFQRSWHTLQDDVHGIWRAGLPDASRSDVFAHAAPAVPPAGLSLESFSARDGLLPDPEPATLSGQQQVWYESGKGEAAAMAPAFPPRRAFTENAVLDAGTLSQLSAWVTPEKLTGAGYHRAVYLFTRDGEAKERLWSARRDAVTYAAEEHFYLPESWRASLLTGAAKVTRDKYDCVVTHLRDAAGLCITADYDWRFLTPVRLTDVNDNVHTATLDALGRVSTLRFRGTEDGSTSGYSEVPWSAPGTAEAALSLTAPLPVHQCFIYITGSWMHAPETRLPPHAVMLTTDRYDSDPAQQVRQQVVFSDGSGRILRTAVRQAPGEALQRTADGSLTTGADGAPAVAVTPSRWAVTGQTEYNNKGQPVRTFRPYYLDSWKPVSNGEACSGPYADTHFYDPPGREWQVRTAAGWLRRTLFTPWFVVSEDENDTAAQAEAAGNHSSVTASRRDSL